MIIAKEYGAKNYRSMRLAIHTDVAFGLAAGVLLTILGVTFAPTILRWMNTPADVLPQSVSYFRVYFCGSVFPLCTIYLWESFRRWVTAGIHCIT